MQGRVQESCLRPAHTGFLELNQTAKKICSPLSPHQNVFISLILGVIYAWTVNVYKTFVQHGYPNCSVPPFSFFLLLLFSILFLSLFVLFSLSVSCIYSQINVLRSDICLNIYRTFVQHGYVNCSVTPFGSSVNGLGQRGCDLDVYIDLGTVLLTVLWSMQYYLKKYS